MPKNPNSKSKKPVKQPEPMNLTMKLFLAGCVAELYLLLIRRFYINGPAEQQILWFDVYLKNLILGGVAILAIGGILSFVWRQDRKKRVYGWCVAGAGAFVAVSTGIVLWSMSTLSLLSVVVPVVMLLCILWTLYDRECALSLSILSATLIILWICRHHLSSIYMGTTVKVIVALYIVALIVLAVLAKQEKLGKLLPANADSLPVLASCGLSIVALAVALISQALTYYAMWGLALVVFGMAVYYTVKQL